MRPFKRSTHWLLRRLSRFLKQARRATQRPATAIWWQARRREPGRGKRASWLPTLPVAGALSTGERHVRAHPLQRAVGDISRRRVGSGSAARSEPGPGRPAGSGKQGRGNRFAERRVDYRCRSPRGAVADARRASPAWTDRNLKNPAPPCASCAETAGLRLFCNSLRH